MKGKSYTKIEGGERYGTGLALWVGIAKNEYEVIDS